jgi:hypothetical protein
VDAVAAGTQGSSRQQQADASGGVEAHDDSGAEDSEGGSAHDDEQQQQPGGVRSRRFALKAKPAAARVAGCVGRQMAQRLPTDVNRACNHRSGAALHGCHLQQQRSLQYSSSWQHVLVLQLLQLLSMLLVLPTIILLLNSTCCYSCVDKICVQLPVVQLLVMDGRWMGWCPMSLSLARKTGDVPVV